MPATERSINRRIAVQTVPGKEARPYIKNNQKAKRPGGGA
jgi:hypothetical protein